MSTVNLRNQLDEVKRALSRHAALKTAQAAPESFPESGGTKATPAGTFGSDPQLKKDNEVPASSRTTAGATEDINPKLAPSILTGGTPSPDAPSAITPMTSDGKDANKLNPGLKTASPLGLDLLAEIEKIQGIQKTAQAALAALATPAAPVQKVAEPTPPSVPAKETQTAIAKAEEEKPVATTKAPEEIPAEMKPKTAGDVLTMTEPMLAKIASICLADAEGADFVSKKVTEHMGKEAADRAMSVLRAQHDQLVALEKSAAEQDELSLYEKLGQEVVDMAVDSALGEMNPAAPSMGAEALGGMPAGDPAIGGAPSSEAPVDPAAIEAALSQASPEELEQVIGELLASGQLSEEDLAAITAALGDEGGAPAGAPSAESPAAEAPPAPSQPAPSEPASESAPAKEESKETVPEGEEKSASAKTGAAALMKALANRKGK